eukprot:jgi/Astpho2/2072/Aster-00566
MTESEPQEAAAGARSSPESVSVHPVLPLPPNEAQRIQAVQSLKILNTSEDPYLTSVSKLLGSLLKAPISGFSHPREFSFCGHTFLDSQIELLVVPDATKDVRFMNNPFVTGPPFVRFYAGCPLVVSSGYRLGAMCVMDQAPRELSVQQLQLLPHFAEMVVRHLEKDRKALLQQAAAGRLLTRSIECVSEGLMLCNMSEPGWPVLHANQGWQQALPQQGGALTGNHLTDIFPIAEDSKVCSEGAAFALSQNHEFTLAVGEMQGRSMLLRFRPASKPQLDSSAPLVGLPSFLEPANTPASTGLYFVSLMEDTPSLVNSAGSEASSLLPASIQRPGGPRSKSFLSAASSAGGSFRGVMFSFEDGSSSFGQGMFHSPQPLYAPAEPHRGARLAPEPLDAFSDVTIREPLRQGVDGELFRAEWRGSRVAVKVGLWCTYLQAAACAGRTVYLFP